MKIFIKPAKPAFPFKWPFPASPAKAPVSQPRRTSATAGRLTRKSMFADVVLVIFWGASIPGLMWLGAAGGF